MDESIGGIGRPPRRSSLPAMSQVVKDIQLAYGRYCKEAGKPYWWNPDWTNIVSDFARANGPEIALELNEDVMRTSARNGYHTVKAWIVEVSKRHEKAHKAEKRQKEVEAQGVQQAADLADALDSQKAAKTMKDWWSGLKGAQKRQCFDRYRAEYPEFTALEGAVRSWAWARSSSRTK